MPVLDKDIQQLRYLNRKLLLMQEEQQEYLKRLKRLSELKIEFDGLTATHNQNCAVYPDEHAV